LQSFSKLFFKSDEAKEFIVPEAMKAPLRQIQRIFFPPNLKDKFESKFTHTMGFYLYSNDGSLILDYFKITHFEKSLAASSALDSKPKRNTIGINIGNGSILSLLPEIPANDILLLDVEPVVLLSNGLTN
jgi:hypothetical protein